MKYFQVSPTLTKWEVVKMTGPVIVFSIVLPLVDIVTDIRSITKLYTLGNSVFASMFLGLGFMDKRIKIPYTMITL